MQSPNSQSHPTQALQRRAGIAGDPFASRPEIEGESPTLIPPIPDEPSAQIVEHPPSAHLNQLNEDMAITREGCRLDLPEQRTLHDAYYHELFSLYVQCRGDIVQICERSGLFPGAIMEWLEQPHVLAAIARFRAHQEFAGALKTMGALFDSIDHLTAAAESATRGSYDAPASPPERRRAATSLSRAADNLAKFLKPARTNPAQRASDQPEKAAPGPQQARSRTVQGDRQRSQDQAASLTAAPRQSSSEEDQSSAPARGSIPCEDPALPAEQPVLRRASAPVPSGENRSKRRKPGARTGPLPSSR